MARALSRRSFSAQGPKLIPLAAFEAILASTQLFAILPGEPIHLICHAHHFRLFLIAPPLVAAVAFVVGEIETRGIPLGDAQAFVAFVVIPSDEIQGIFYITTTLE